MLAKLDFMTIGSSLPVCGIDHEAHAALVQEHDDVHANPSMSGPHWVTVDVPTDWLAGHRPPLHGGNLAMDLTTFKYPGSGGCELTIAAPFRDFVDGATVVARVPLDIDEKGTWGRHSVLHQYHEDIRDSAPATNDRLKALRWWREFFKASDVVLRNTSEARIMYEFGAASVAARHTVKAGTGAAADGLQHQCRELRATLAERDDFGALLRQTPLPSLLQQMSGTMRNPPACDELEAPSRRRADAADCCLGGSVAGRAARMDAQRAAAIRRRRCIRVIDATDALADVHSGGCDYYFDFFHKNNAGRTALMVRVRPRLRSALYGDARTATAAGPMP